MTKSLLFVGGSNRKVDWLAHANSPGISCFEVDEETAAAKLLSVTAGIDNPTFLSVSPDGALLAATSEVGEWDEGTISLYRIGNGKLDYVNKQATRGDNTAHSSFHPTKPLVAIANYSSRPAAQSIVLYRTGELLSPPLATAIHAGSGPNPARQERSHPHCARWSPDGRFLLVPDLGMDRVVIYRLEGDDLRPHGDVVLPPGSGPRHVAFHPSLPFAYLANELASTVATLAWDASAGALSVVAVNSSLDGVSGTYYASGVIVAPDGRHLLSGNRGARSSVARFAINQSTGIATLVGASPLDGWPRDLTFSPTGTLVAVANQDRERVELFRHGAGDGSLTALPPIAVGTPTAVVFVPQT